MTTHGSKGAVRLIVLGVIAGAAMYLLYPRISAALIRARMPLLHALEPKPTPTAAPPPAARPAGLPPSGGWSLGQARESSLDGLRLGDVDSAGTIYAADGFDVLALTLDGRERWRTTLESRKSHVDAPHLAGSTLIVSGADKLSILSLAGEVRWETSLEPGSDPKLLAFANGRFVVRGPRNSVRAFANDGRELWSRDFEEHRIGGVAMDDEGRTYIAVAGRLFAVDASGGDLWRYGGKELESSGPTAHMLTVGPDGILYGTSAWSIVALRPGDGHVVWQDVGYGTSCAADGISWAEGNVYTACQSTASSYSAEGQRRWRVTLEHPGRLQPPVVDESGTVYLAARAVVRGTETGFGELTAISDADGAVRWTVVLQRPLTTRPLVGRDGVVYVGGDNRLYAVSPAGQLLWERQLHPNDNWSVPVVRLEATPAGIAGSAHRTFMIPLAVGADAPRTFSWRRPGE